MEIYYTVYKVTNKVNGKIYIGCHKTKNLDDGYMGSGIYLKHSIEKYGIENFEKEILFIYDNSYMMFKKEKELVNKNFLNKDDNYNLTIGGNGGWDYINSNGLNKGVEYINSIKGLNIKANQCYIAAEKIKSDPEYKKYFSERVKNGFKKANYVHGYTFKGRKHKDSTKKIISEKAKKRLEDPSKNPNYGKRWIYSLKEKRSKLIDKNKPLPYDWFEGRKIKF